VLLEGLLRDCDRWAQNVLGRERALSRDTHGQSGESKSLVLHFERDGVDCFARCDDDIYDTYSEVERVEQEEVERKKQEPEEQPGQRQWGAEDEGWREKRGEGSWGLLKQEQPEPAQPSTEMDADPTMELTPWSGLFGRLAKQQIRREMGDADGTRSK
jgi:hypothetical protein